MTSARQIARHLRRVIRRAFPAGSRRGVLVRRVAQLLWYGRKKQFMDLLRRFLQFLLFGRKNQFTEYRLWVRSVEPATLSPVLSEQPELISVVVPCHNTPQRYIAALIDSLVRQTYSNWELCLADSSTEPEAAEAIMRCASRDARITYAHDPTQRGIANNTNACVQTAKGRWVAFVDHDDVLPPWALNEVATAIADDPDADILYSDEDRLTENGKLRLAPFFKPDWSPDLFLSVNYVSHLFVMKASLLDTLSGLRPEYDGAQDYDLMLRALSHNPRIVHIPKVLYHMRMARTSTATSTDVKGYAADAGSRALEDFLVRQGTNARVLHIPGRPTNYRVKYDLQGAPLVSIIIPFKDEVALLRECVDSVLKTTAYGNYELILVSNNSREEATFDYLEGIRTDRHVRIVHYDKPFNFSAIINFGRKQAQGEVFVFLNNDTKARHGDWLEELVSVALREEVGEVGALLSYPDGTIQHAGVVVGMLGTAGHVFRDLTLGTLTPFWFPDWPRNYLAVTAACVAVAAEKFDMVGGLDEEFITAGSDVRLGLALHEAGYQNVFWPFASLVHYENVSVGRYEDRADSQHDYEVSMRYYRGYIDHGDPYYNPNLDLMSEIPVLRRRSG